VRQGFSEGAIGVVADKSVVKIRQAQGRHGARLFRAGIGNRSAIEAQLDERQGLQKNDALIGASGVVQL
jgi:hypothetical protein